MKKVNTLKRLVSIFVTIATLLPVAANSATQSSYPTKTYPVAGDKALITDSADGNKTKQATVGSMPISTATQSALDGKAGVSCFASASAFNACFTLDWPTGFDVSANYTVTGAWDFTGATVTGISGGSMTWPASDSAYYAARNGAWASLAGIFAPVLGSDDNYVTDAEKVKLGNLSGTNTGDQDLSGFLSKTNTTAFTPTGDWHPATKRYVDDSIAAGGGYTDEQAQDAVGAMLSGNTETGISVTYDDATGKINFDVPATSLPTWMPSVGPTNGRQILQATGGCSLSAYDNQADCETNSGTWTTPTYQHTSIISGLINDTGTADDDLWSAAKIAGELAGKQATLGFTPENTANKGAANGYAGLGSDGKVPSSQLPTSVWTTYELPSLADAQAGTSTTPYVWSPQLVAQAIVALAPSGGGSVILQQSFVSSSTLVADTGAKNKLATGVSWTTADIGCDAPDTLSVSVKSSSTVNGTYLEIGTITLSANSSASGVDISTWADSTSGHWIRIDLSGTPAAAKDCVIAIGGIEL